MVPPDDVGDDGGSEVFRSAVFPKACSRITALNLTDSGRMHGKGGQAHKRWEVSVRAKRSVCGPGLRLNTPLFAVI